MISDYEVHIVEPTAIDVAGFKARRSGLEVRDCLLILEPNNTRHLGLMVRPPMETTVVESVVRGGGGTIAIDESRVSMSVEDVSTLNGKSSKNPREATNPIYGKYSKAIATPAHGRGRFPANLLLRHGPSCTQEGTKTVKGRCDVSGPNKEGEGGQFGTEIYGDSKGRDKSSPRGYGKEEVANWICEDGCPVALLDEISGPTGSWSPKGSVYDSTEGLLRWRASNAGHYGDFGGGASRFFKQVQTEEELEQYLITLVRGTK